MKEIPKPLAGIPGDFMSRDDDRLFQFVDRLRDSVKAKVAAEQSRGLSLAEIVTQVREMTRLAEQETKDPKPFSASGFRAISKQAIAWCIEAYQPAAFIGDKIDSILASEPPSANVPRTVVSSSDRFSISHQPTRGSS